MTLCAQTNLMQGHTDIGIGYDKDANEWDLHIHDEENDVEYAPPSDAVLWVKYAAHGPVPQGPQWSFLGTAGSRVWLLPMVEDSNLLCLGFGAEEIENGVFVNDEFTMTLKSVVGPGHVAVFDADAFGEPVVWMSSRDGINGADAVALPAGAHQHVNWAFSAPGDYVVSFEASGVRADGNTNTASGNVEYLFHVEDGFDDPNSSVVYLTHQHMDFRVEYDANAEGTNRLDILLRYNATSTVGPNYFVVSNQQVYIVGNTNSQLIIPPNPNYAFLGAPGAPIWILPQSQDVTLPYLGTSGEDLPFGVFGGPINFELVSVEGPGNFFAWANTGGGQPPIVKFICTNGVVSPQYNKMTPGVGSHEHYNWGFSTNGLYRVTFRPSGVVTNLPGGPTNIIGREVAWAFQILPLRPWENWVSTNWPPATATNIAGTGADPDDDRIVNLLEYAFGNNPNVALYTNAPAVTFVTHSGTNYGALRYVHATNATDLTLDARASSVLGGASTSITNVSSIVPNGTTETIIVRDSIAKDATTNRFYELKVKLNYP